MRRLAPYIPLLATLLALCAAGQTVLAGSAGAAEAPTVNKAALNKAVQEALAKAQVEKGAQGAGGVGGAGAAAGAAGAAGSAAGGSGAGIGSSEALSNLTSGGGEEEATPTPTTPTATSSSSGISTSVLIPIGAVGGVLLLGIAFFIVRDARSVAPAGDGFGGGGSARDRAARQRKRRAKAKAARQQRKRNR
jgi:hypothetical protein